MPANLPELAKELAKALVDSPEEVLSWPPVTAST